jgi:rsbT co-antagonist protein RsbR
MSKSHAVVHSALADEASQHNNTLSWFDITPADQERVRSLAPIADHVGEEIIADFYAHILRFEEAAQQFADDTQIERVKRGQKKYFQELINAELDESYAEERKRIGGIHERAGITPTLYVGSYAYYLQRLSQSILENGKEDPHKLFGLVLSMMKIAHYDMALALETYVEAREKTIEIHERQMRELPTPVLELREGLLLVPVVGALDSQRARTLTMQLLDGIRDKRSRAVVLDITGAASIDSSVANHLFQAMTAARLMGAKSILAGITPTVAQELFRIGVDTKTFTTARNLQQGIELAASELEAHSERSV